LTALLRKEAIKSQIPHEQIDDYIERRLMEIQDQYESQSLEQKMRHEIDYEYLGEPKHYTQAAFNKRVEQHDNIVRHYDEQLKEYAKILRKDPSAHEGTVRVIKKYEQLQNKIDKEVKLFEKERRLYAGETIEDEGVNAKKLLRNQLEERGMIAKEKSKRRTKEGHEKLRPKREVERNIREIEEVENLRHLREGNLLKQTPEKSLRERTARKELAEAFGEGKPHNKKGGRKKPNAPEFGDYDELKPYLTKHLRPSKWHHEQDNQSSSVSDSSSSSGDNTDSESNSDKEFDIEGGRRKAHKRQTKHKKRLSEDVNVISKYEPKEQALLIAKKGGAKTKRASKKDPKRPIMEFNDERDNWFL
jgi:hypothetical protein